MSVKAKLVSLMPKINKSANKNDLDNANRGMHSQTFLVIIYRDQELYIYLVRDTTKSLAILNFIKLRVASLVIGTDQVLRINELAETISDVIEVFIHESNAGRSINELPTIVMLEPSKFDIGYVNLDATTYSEAVEDLDDKTMYDIFAKSPYIQDDTLYEPFTVSNDFGDGGKLNIMYSSKRFLTSWANVVEEIGLKMAYIGSSSSPILLDIAEKYNNPYILLDMQRLSSKIYCINGSKEPIIELKFPYGYMQFISSENSVSCERLRVRLFATIKQSNVPSVFKTAKVILTGLPSSVQTTSLKTKDIEKATDQTLKVVQKKIIRKQGDEGSGDLALDLTLNIQSICRRLFE